jgi:hypothetical protein
MKKLLILILSLITILITLDFSAVKYENTSLKSVSGGEVNLIFEQIKAQSNYNPPKATSITVKSCGMVNAWVYETDSDINITVCRELLSIMHDRDELAYVLGHEWGHAVLRHTVVGLDYDNQLIEEYNADLVGQQYARLAGYDPNLAAVTWHTFVILYGPGIDGSHPAQIKRFHYLLINGYSPSFILKAYIFPNIVVLNKFITHKINNLVIDKLNIL